MNGLTEGSPYHYLGRAICIGAAIATSLIGLSAYNKLIGSTAFQLNTPLEYLVFLTPPLFAVGSIGAYRDYRATRKKGVLIVALAGTGVSLALFLFMAWVASIAAGTR